MRHDHYLIPLGRRAPTCPGACACQYVCGQAVIDARVEAIPADELRGAVSALSELWGAAAELGPACAPTPESGERLQRALDAALKLIEPGGQSED